MNRCQKHQDRRGVYCRILRKLHPWPMNKWVCTECIDILIRVHGARVMVQA